MEKESMNASYSDFSSSADGIVSILYYIFFWVASLHEISFRFLCFTHVSKSEGFFEIEPTTSTNRNSKKSELELSVDDLEMVMQKMGISEELRKEQMNGSIAFEEVSCTFEEKEPSLEEAKEAFSVFDKNLDGFIDASELQTVLSELGFKAEVGLDECQEMIGVHDENKDGRIDFDEFLKFLESSLC